jgi:hypothetical protein
VSRPNLYELPIWEDFEHRVVEVFSQGLAALATKARLPLQEDYLSRELHNCCREANHRLRKRGRGVDCIFAQSNNQPLPDDEYRAKRLDKRPDFTCGYHDDSLPNEAFDQADFYYAIECKRLGTPTSANWLFNKNYVEYGIARFEHPDWGYAAGSSSGMMVGFVQTMDPEAILADVNSHIPPFPTLSVNGWSHHALTKLDPHVFNRRIIRSPFTLNHFWIDLRRCDFFEVVDPKKPRRTPKSPSSTKKQRRNQKSGE